MLPVRGSSLVIGPGIVTDFLHPHISGGAGGIGHEGLGQCRIWAESGRESPISPELTGRADFEKLESGTWQFTGPCPACGGADRFRITRKPDAVFG